MSFTHALSEYLSFNVLLAVGFLTLRLGAGRFSAASELRFNYAMLAFAFLLSVALPFLPGQQFFAPVVKVWSAKSTGRSTVPAGRVTVGGFSASRPVTTSAFARFGALLAFAIVTLSIWRLVAGLYQLRRLSRGSYLLRRYGRTSIYVCPRVRVPLSYWLPGQANVLLPLDTGHFASLVIAHELQHHRQGDTKWLFVLWALRQLCFWNPAIYLWSHWLQEKQEFACDEAVVGRKMVDLQAYTRCLVETAIQAHEGADHPVCATGLILHGGRRQLSRRIEKMSKEKVPFKRQPMVAVILVAAALLTGTAFASRGLVQDRRLTLAQAQELLKHAQSSDGFPVVVNESVLKWLNHYIGTPEGRLAMRQALARLETYRGLVTTKLQVYGLPAELMAIPITESGYQNLPERNEHGVGAGLWMFIPSTARKYGLRVDSAVDDRLAPPLETDAAMRYFKANDLRFADWQLAVMAYNMGEGRVQEGIDKTGSRDAWTLINAGYEGDSDYLAKFMAAILIMKNPSSVD